MDTKVQKIKIKYAKYRTNGFILDFIIKGLGISQKNENFQKIYQRFKKEEDIGVNEYHDTYNTLLSDIVYTLKIDEKDIPFFQNFIQVLFQYLNLIKLTNETLNCAQKQLDFIFTMDVLIPLSTFYQPKNKLLSIEKLFPSSHKNSIQKLFEIINNDLHNKNNSIKQILFDILNNNEDKLISYDSINTSIVNWLNGKSIPNSQHIELISELATCTNNFSKNEFFLALKIAALIQSLYNKSINYFGVSSTELLINHFIFIKKLITYSSNGYDRTLITKIYSHINYDFLSRYAYLYIDLNLQLFQNIFKSSLQPDLYDRYQNKKLISIIKENYKYQELLYKIDETTFFNNIDTILPIKYFQNKLTLTQLKKISAIKTSNSDLLVSMYLKTLPNEVKTTKNEEKLLEEMNNFKNIYNVTEDPYFSFICARYYAQKCQYKEATKYYILALKHGINCMGEHTKYVIKEGLLISALDTRKDKVDLINAKSDFTKFYKKAYFYKLIDDLPKEININFLLDMKKQFTLYFKNLFPNTKETRPNIITPNFFTTDKKIVKIDFNKPNKLIKYPNPITQLMYCASHGDYKSVKELVNAGASVNTLKSNDNASALLLSFPPSILQEYTSSARKIATYLIPKMSKEVLNTKLVKQKESALSYAIAHGEYEIVKLLIKYEVDVTKPVTLDNFSALYLCLNLIGLSKRDTFNPINSNFNSVHPYNSKEERKKLAKANMFGNSIFDEEKDRELNHLLDNDLFQSEAKEVESLYFVIIKQKREAYYKIFDLILESSSKVDLPHKNNFTPLILATELNEEALVIKLLEKGANPDWYTDEHHRAYDYALVNKNKKLIKLLE